MTTILIVVVLYVVALIVVLLLVGGVRRGDELHDRALRSMSNTAAEPPGPERYSPKQPEPPKSPPGRNPINPGGGSTIGR